MPPITFDGQSLILDGRREWLVCAALPYTNHPREEWPLRLADAAQAGFNCVLIPCVWSAHEPRKGAFDFAGERDVRALLQLIRKAGLRCILRVGPFVGAPWDMGGIPAWVGASADRSKEIAGREGLVAASQAHWSALRAGAPEFLEAASRWITALCEQVRDQQYTVGTGGPIVMAQLEHEWLCADPVVAEGYLAELARFAREAGLTVPLINANNLHAAAEGDIEGWSGGMEALSTARQLHAVKPNQPVFLLDLASAPAPSWGGAEAAVRDPRLEQSSLLQAIAGGAQCVVSPFAPGLVPGFLGGRSGDAPHAYYVPNGGAEGAPIDDAGKRTRTFDLIKRVATFASTFGRLFAARERASASLLTPPAGAEGHAALARIDGPRGGADFLFAPLANVKNGAPVFSVLDAEGARHTLHPGGQAVAWRVENVHLHGRTTLDYCDACPFAHVGRVFVCFLPAGQVASLSLNGGKMSIESPSGSLPVIEEHDGVVVVVCNEAQIDAAFATRDAVHIGVAGLTPDGQPLAHPDFRVRVRISAEGAIEKVAVPAPKGARARAPALSDWKIAPADEHAAGRSPRYASIVGPARMEALGAPFGYGWLRCTLGVRESGSVKAGFFNLADRAGLYLNGEFQAVAGVGPGAEGDVVALALKKGEQTLTMLIDNLGRAAGGSTLGEPKGLWGSPVESAPFRVGAPSLEVGEPLSALAFRSPLMGVRDTDRTDPHRVTWTFNHRRKTPIVMAVEAFAAPALLIVNDTTVDFLDHADRPRITLTEKMLNTGKNTVQLALVLDHASEATPEGALKAMRTGVRFFEAVGPIAAKEAWAFAKWEPPGKTAFHEPARPGARHPGPAWWRAHFSAANDGAGPAVQPPLALELTGLTKGQVFLNGRNLCRYFVATEGGKRVPGQTRVVLPGAWRKTEGENEIMLFDEHGASPAKTRITLA